MRWTLAAASALLAALIWLPSQAASPSNPPAASATNPETITFEQYRDWRLRYNERRQAQIARRLKATDLTAAQKDRLEQLKGYFDWLAGLPGEERDRRFRERFDRIDTNHDGIISRAERAAWREQRREYYRQRTTARAAPQK
jgi:hypothetical protein